MEVISPESGVALGTLPLTRVVPRLHALEAEDVEALRQDGVLHTRVATGTGEACLGGVGEREGGGREGQSYRGSLARLSKHPGTHPLTGRAGTYLVLINLLIENFITV